MTSDSNGISLMRPVSCGGEPRSSISVMRRRSNPQSAFWTGGRKRIWVGWGLQWKVWTSKPPHLYHDVLQLVVWIGHVGRRQDQQSPLLVELIQESAQRLHVCLNLQRCKHTKSWSRRSTLFAGVELVSAQLPADSRSHRAGSPSQSPLKRQTRLDIPLSSYPPSQRYSHVAP